MPEALASFMSNNYGNNYYVADVDGASTGACSADGFSLDDADEIDTNNMAIYKTRAAKNRHSGAGTMQAAVKQEPVEVEQVPMPRTLRRQPSAGNSGKSLLIPSKSIPENEQDAIDEDDLIMNVLEDVRAGGSLLAGPSMSLDSDQIAVQNTMFDETSQVSRSFKIQKLFIF
jgi:hypothetical protein